MDSQQNCASWDGFERINQFALVGYIPDPLGRFLDALRLHLVPDCKPHAHVTILPPRPLCGSAEDAAREIRLAARDFQPFSIRLGDVARFEKSDVIYIEIASGCSELKAMYHAMNAGCNSYCEKFCYSPHITLAQNLPAELVQHTLDEAVAAWKNFPFEKAFRVDVLTFVQNTSGCRWIDLEEMPLGYRTPGRPSGVLNQRDVAAPQHQA